MIQAVTMIILVAASTVLITAGDLSAAALDLPPSGFAAALDPSSMTVPQLFSYYGQALVPAAVLCAFLYALYKFIRYVRFKDGFEEEARRK